MSNDYPKKLTEQDERRIYQELIKLRTGDGSEVTEAPKRIDRILEKYGGGLGHVAENPEWLLGQGNGSSPTEYAELYQEFQKAMQYNRELANDDASKAEEIETLRGGGRIYVFNPFNKDGLAASSFKKKCLEEAKRGLEQRIGQLKLENADLKLELEEANNCTLDKFLEGMDGMERLAQQLWFLHNINPESAKSIFTKLTALRDQNDFLEEENERLKTASPELGAPD